MCALLRGACNGARARVRPATLRQPDYDSGCLFRVEPGYTRMSALLTSKPNGSFPVARSRPREAGHDPSASSSSRDSSLRSCRSGPYLLSPSNTTCRRTAVRGRYPLRRANAQPMPLVWSRIEFVREPKVSRLPLRRSEFDMKSSRSYTGARPVGAFSERHRKCSSRFSLASP